MHLDHIDLRVRDLAAARPLYDMLLPAMGNSEINGDEGAAGYHVPNARGADPFVWLVQDPAHKPNGTRIAFAANSRAEVDRLAEVARCAGARAFEAPAIAIEYGPHYYAAFFEDASGNKLEICCRRPE